VHRPETIEGLVLAEFAIVDLAVTDTSVFQSACEQGSGGEPPPVPPFDLPPPARACRYAVDAADSPGHRAGPARRPPPRSLGVVGGTTLRKL
jgi:hypothetical protein